MATNPEIRVNDCPIGKREWERVNMDVSIGGPSAVHERRRYFVSLAVLTTLFFMWGAITSLNDILLPHLKAAFALDYTQATLIQFTFFTAYFLVSLPAGWIVQRIGYKQGIIAGLATAALGCLMFLPAAGLQIYGIFLGALFVLASGITVLQVSANPYVAIIGPAASASARLNQTQAFNSLGTTVAPYVGATLILGGATGSASALAEVSSVKLPYLGLAVTLIAIAALVAAIRLPVIGPATAAGGDETPAGGIGRQRHLLLGAVAIFLYVGGEVSIGSFLVSFLSQPDIGGLTPATAGKYLSYYWGGAMVGRFVGAAVLTRIDAGRALAFHALAAMVLVAVSVISTGSAAMWAILAVGLCNSIMFPTIFTLGIQDLGQYTARGSGLLCMAIVGGALVPLVQGHLADRIGVHASFVVPAVCYLYIIYYGARGSIPRAG